MTGRRLGMSSPCAIALVATALAGCTDTGVPRDRLRGYDTTRLDAGRGFLLAIDGVPEARTEGGLHRHAAAEGL